MLKTLGWISAGPLWGGWRLKLERLVFAQHQSLVNPLPRKRLRSRNLWQGFGGSLRSFLSSDWHLLGGRMERRKLIGKFPYIVELVTFLLSQWLIRFHLGSSRKIHSDQKIHSSLFLFDRDTKTKYIPKARPLDDDDLFWENFSDLSKIEWLELDLYEYTEEVIRSFARDPNDNTLHTLRRIGTSGKSARFSGFARGVTEDRSGDGQQVLYDKVIQFLNTENDLRVKYELLRLAMDVQAPRRHSKLKLSRSTQIRPFISKLLDSSNNSYRKTAQEFIMRFSDRKWKYFFVYKHLRPVSTLICSLCFCLAWAPLSSLVCLILA